MPKRRSSKARQPKKGLYAAAAVACVGVGLSAAILLHRGAPDVALAASGKHSHQDAAVLPGEATPTPLPAIAPPDAAKPDELGSIPILMYHSVGDPPLTGRLARFNHLGLNISAALFRKHLEMLRSAGFYPVNLRDILEPTLNIPRGLTPVVLTFDDARESQFRYHKDGKLDPNCALGVLTAFHTAHPDWPEKATFFVLPKSEYNPAPFGQSRLVKQKFAYLVEHGYEIANHSTSHHPMSHMDAKRLTWEMATCADYVRSVAPEAPPMQTMALPYGIAPAKSLLPVLLGDGKDGYRNRCIVLAAGPPSYSPIDHRFNAMAVPRVGSEPGNIETWIKRLKAARTGTPKEGRPRPYISDGDPETLSAPKSAVKFLDKTRLGDVKLVVYADAVKAKPKHAAPASGAPAVQEATRKI